MYIIYVFSVSYLNFCLCYDVFYFSRPIVHFLIETVYNLAPLEFWIYPGGVWTNAGRCKQQPGARLYAIRRAVRFWLRLAAHLSKPCLVCLAATLNEIQFAGKEVRFEATDVSFLRRKWHRLLERTQSLSLAGSRLIQQHNQLFAYQ